MDHPLKESHFLTLKKIGPFMSFTEEQLAFRDSIRKMVAKHVAPIAAEIDENDRFPLEIVKLFGEMGRKQWCSDGVAADYIVVMARTGDGPGADGISAFIVEPKKMEGISFGRHERKMGFRGAPNTPIFFDNVRVPAENLVGEEGRGFRASMRALDLNRPTIGAQSVGLAQGALDASIAYAKERKQFKKTISEFQGIQFMLAGMAMQLVAARA